MNAHFAARFAAPWSVRRTIGLLLDRRTPAWTGARMVCVTVELDGEVARAWLPPGLAPARPARALVFVADYPVTSFGFPYRECGVLVHARHHGRPVLHCAWMVVDDDRALILGRELLGFPKKLATIDFEWGGDGRARTAVHRHGSTLMRLNAEPDGTRRDGVPLPHPIVNAYGLPGPLPGVLLAMDVPQRVHDGRGARCTLTLAGTAADPLDGLGAGTRTLPGQTVVADLGVPPAGRALPPVRPVGLVSPAWFASRYPFRVW